MMHSQQQPDQQQVNRTAKLTKTIINARSSSKATNQNQVRGNSSQQNSASKHHKPTSTERDQSHLQKIGTISHQRKVSGQTQVQKNKQLKSLLQPNESGLDFNTSACTSKKINQTKDKSTTSHVEKMKQITSGKMGGEKRQFSNMFAKILVGQQNTMSTRQQKKLSKADMTGGNMTSKFLDGVKGTAHQQNSNNLNQYVSHGMLKQPSHGLYSNRGTSKKGMNESARKLHKSSSHRELNGAVSSSQEVKNNNKA